MEVQKQNEEGFNKFWISTTGYRTFLVLKSLMQKSCTIDELVEIIQKNPYANKAASKDTIRLDIATLKKAGCDISRPSKANNYKYELLKHPFILNLSEEEIKILIDLREKLASVLSIEEIFSLNNLYEKMINLTFNKEQISNIIESSPLINIDKTMYYQLSNPNIINKKVQIRYKSPEYGEEDIDIIPQKILYENKKLYLRCFNFKYNSLGLLDFERILKINNINMSENYTPTSSYKVVYELIGNIIPLFERQDYEKILEQSKDKIVVEATVENEFFFIQRIIQFGVNFRIISPEFFKEKLINKIKSIQRVYK